MVAFKKLSGGITGASEVKVAIEKGKIGND